MSLIGTLGSGVSALRTFTKGLEVIGNNIANVNTTGYKSSDARYADSFSNVLRDSSPSGGSGASNSPSVAIGTGVSLAGVNKNFSQGSLASTGRETDLAVSGNGFFRVTNPDDNSTFATRSGEFRWDDKGFLVTQDGFRVQGLTGSARDAVGDIKLGTPPTSTQLQSVTINKAGEVVEFYSDGTSATNNQVLLQNFADPSALTSIGNNLYTSLAAAGPIGGTALQVGTNNVPGENGLGAVQSGALELSNVDLTDEFSKLITAQRSFQAGSRLITVSDGVLEEIVNLKRG